jgi:hypothetical protein
VNDYAEAHVVEDNYIRHKQHHLALVGIDSENNARRLVGVEEGVKHHVGLCQYRTAH